jgi:hypothetical protein
MKRIPLLSVMLLAIGYGMAQTTDITENVKLQAWSDPVTILNDDAKPWSTNNDAYVYSQAIAPGETTTLTVKLNPTMKSTFCFDAYQGSSTDMQNQLRAKLEVKVDGTTWRTVSSAVLQRQKPRFFIDLTPGNHTITFTVTNDRPEGYKQDLRLGFYGLMKTDRVVTAEVTEPGSLGQEILYNVEQLADVQRLKVTGTLNDADWTTIGNMSNTLWEIDLSGVTLTPAYPTADSEPTMMHGPTSIRLCCPQDSPISEAMLSSTPTSPGLTSPAACRPSAIKLSTTV